MKINIFNTINSILEEVTQLKKKGIKIGFVPTMGALHSGHISLVEQAKEENDLVFVSIFVNPTQFNNQEDLEKYPRTLDKDIELLEKNGVYGVFAPNKSEIYPENYIRPTIDLGQLDKVMEGEHRPGHFQGVVEVVKRLFEIVQPTNAYFGIKDFQQVAVIKFMTNYFQLPVNIVECPINRSEEGLALSSRNMRLSEEEKEKALILYQTLSFAKENWSNFTPEELSKRCIEMIQASDLKLEYLEIVHPLTLEKLTTTWTKNAVCCIAAYCGEVRLIDNMNLETK